MWFLENAWLIPVVPAVAFWLILFFGGLFMAYMLYRTWYHDAFREASTSITLFWGLLNTVVLIGSSLTMALAVRSAQLSRRQATVNWLVMTILLGAVFLGAIASLVSYWAVVSLKPVFRYDDSLDVFGIHGVAGIVGAIGTGIVGAPFLGGFGAFESIGAQVVVQAQAVAVCIVWTGVVSFVALGALWKEPRLHPEDGRLLPPSLASTLDSPVVRGVFVALALTITGWTLLALVFGQDDANNPVPNVVFVWLWVGLAFLSMLVGGVWRLLNPVRWLRRGLFALGRIGDDFTLAEYRLGAS